jgi:ferritin-like metal-binding protein YciE
LSEVESRSPVEALGPAPNATPNDVDLVRFEPPWLVHSLLDCDRVFVTRTSRRPTMSAENLRELLIEQMKDIYDAEQRITKALPKMVKAADSDELRQALEGHLRETQEQVRRLEQAFEIFDESPKRKECKAMVGLLAEGAELMDEDNPPDVMDASLIAAAQKVEHYEIATYGCLRTWADLLGEDEAVRLFQLTLDEEGDTDKKLTDIAQSLNVEAMAGESEEEEKVPVRVTKRNTRS